MNRDSVRDYYRERMQNEGEAAADAVEFEVNRRMIERHLPEEARVLDLGDGEGRYAAWLAGRGYRVVPAGHSSGHLATERDEISAGSAAGDVTTTVQTLLHDLTPWPDASFDAVLCLKSFDHLTDAEDRERVTSEMARVLRPGGVAFVALKSRFSVLRGSLIRKSDGRSIASPEFIAKILSEESPEEGQPAGPPRGEGVQPDEVAPFFEGHGFTSLGLFASEGIATGIQNELAQLAKDDPAAYQRAIDLVMETAADPSILGMSSHILYVGRRAGIPAAKPVEAPAENIMATSEASGAPAAMPAERYGAVELKRVYNRNLLIALGISVALHGAVIGYYLFGGDDTPLPPKIALDDLPAPRSDTNWSVPITLTKPQGGGGSPDVDKPLGRASKGAPNATPDRTRDNVDKDRSVIIRNPDKIRPVDKEPPPLKVAGDTRDTSAKTNVTGTRGQNPNGIGDKPAGGSGGPGIGVGIGSATGLGSRGWVVRPHATYPGGLNATGTVMLRFTVLPNGDITNITPVKRADQALVNAAIAGLRRAKARPLPDNVPQIAQVATIPFTFELK